jgi:hypothetical protein
MSPSGRVRSPNLSLISMSQRLRSRPIHDSFGIGGT